jgi:hypothetical protein
MVIPYVLAGAALLFFARAAWMKLSLRANERDLNRRIRNRSDLRLLRNRYDDDCDR